MSLRAIITALATTVTPEVGGITPQARYLESLRDNVEPASLPVRLIVPTSQPGGTSGGGEALGACGISGDAGMTWTIGDMLLVAAIPLSDIGSNQAALVDYADAYVDAIRAARTLAGALVNGWTIDFGIYEWPAGSGRWFYGLVATVTVRETR